MTFFESALYQSELETAINGIVDVQKLFGKKILITGAAGFVGSFLVETLVKLNREQDAQLSIFALGRNESRLKARFSSILDEIHLVIQDVSNPLALDDKMDMIIHAASNANPRAYSEDPVGTIQGNIAGVKNLLDYARANSVEQFLFISSGEVYGELPKEAVPFSETMAGFIDPMNVRSCYMLSKKMSENMCVSYEKQYGVVTKIVRLSHVFGPNYTDKDNRVSATFVSDALQAKDIILKSLGNQQRSYVYISDCVSGILSVLTAGQSANAYNVTRTANAISLADFAHYVAAEAGVKVLFDLPETVDASVTTPISFAILDDQKLRATGWQPQVDMAQGMHRTISILK
ncbi:NAD-dependent epimerase/dehydratase family protein [Lactococcus sp.]|uniref:NAD-dependent epimerase/dehydratase family protein n=1 Tax=Lactococcus sp. TaxID=44273 RepID=UPI0035B395DC